MTEAVPLSELLHEEALFFLTGQKGWSTPTTLIPVWTLPLSHISSSLGVARPFTNKVEKGWKKCTDRMVGGARSITLNDACTPSPGNSIKSQTFVFNYIFCLFVEPNFSFLLYFLLYFLFVCF